MSALLSAFSDLIGSIALLLGVFFLFSHGRLIGHGVLKLSQAIVLLALTKNGVQPPEGLWSLLIHEYQPDLPSPRPQDEI